MKLCQRSVIAPPIPLLEPTATPNEPAVGGKPASLARFHEGRAPHNSGLRYPPEPPTVEAIIPVMRAERSSVT